MDDGLFTTTEISRILDRARSGRTGAGASASPQKPEPFKFQSAGQLSAAQVAKLLEVHVNFSNQLGRSLSSLLGSECTVTSTGAEQIGYGDLIGQTPAGAMFGTLQVQHPDTVVFLHAELATVLPVIDLMLGGEGKATEAVRPLTEVEQEIFKPVVEMFAAELQTIWAPLVETSLRYGYEGAAEDVFPANQWVLAFKFEIRIGECHGTWNLILTSLLSNALIRKVEQQATVAKDEKSDGSERRLRERLLDSRFRLELSLPPTTVSVRMLAHLKVGQVVVLKQPSSDPIQVNLEGINLFQASPVSCGNRRGAQIIKVFPIATGEEKEKR